MQIRNVFLMILTIVTGAVIGGLVATWTANVPGLAWLSFGTSFGLTTPLELDMAVIKLTLGFVVQINIAMIVGIILALLLYRWLMGKQ